MSFDDGMGDVSSLSFEALAMRWLQRYMIPHFADSVLLRAAKLRRQLLSDSESRRTLSLAHLAQHAPVGEVSFVSSHHVRRCRSEAAPREIGDGRWNRSTALTLH